MNDLFLEHPDVTAACRAGVPRVEVEVEIL